MCMVHSIWRLPQVGEHLRVGKMNKSQSQTCSRILSWGQHTSGENISVQNVFKQNQTGCAFHMQFQIYISLKRTHSHTHATSAFS